MTPPAMSRAALFLLALALSATAPEAVLAQQGGQPPLRRQDFSGLWGARPGGPAAVEIRVSDTRLVARELFNNQAAGRCGTEGRGRVTGPTSTVSFRGVCANGQRTTETRCRVTLETRDRISTSCSNGHNAVLHRVGG